MSPQSGSESAPNDQQIREQQARIDMLDQSKDRQVKVGSSAEESEKLTKTYIGKVDTLRGRLQDARRKVEVQKDMKAPHWQDLEDKCRDVEQKLFAKLSEIDGNNAKQKADSFNASIDDFLKELNGQEQAAALPSSVEEQRREREKWRTTLSELQDQDQKLQQDINKGVETLANHTEKKASEEQINSDVAALRTLQAQKAALLPKMDEAGKKVRTLDYAVIHAQVDVARKAGKGEEADRLLLRAYQEYGDNLSVDSPALWAQIAGGKEDEGAIQRLDRTGKLTEFERALYVKHDSKAALKEATERYNKLDEHVDILDQVNQQHGMRVGDIKTPAERFKDGKRRVEVVDQNGKPYNLPYIASIQPLNGGKMTVSLSEDGKGALDTISAAHAQPLLLRKVDDPRFRAEAYLSSRQLPGVWNNIVGNKEHYVEVTVSQDDTRLTAADFAYEKDGKIYDGTGKEISPTDPKLAVALKERSMARAFNADSYSPYERGDAYKPIFRSLKLADGQGEVSSSGADYYVRKGDKYVHLHDITTPDGRRIRGVGFTNEAAKMLQTEPPKGKQLVFRREPHPIQIGRSKNVDKGNYTEVVMEVTSYDTIDVSDLAYANLEDNKTQLSVQRQDPSASSRVGVRGLEKNREEQSRDMLRALDHDQSTTYVRNLATTMQGSLANVQRLLTAGQVGKKRESFVAFARGEAKPLLDILNNPELPKNLASAKESLLQLKQASLGIALGGLEKEIDARIKALDQFTKVLVDAGVRNTLQSILDASKFDEDTFMNWLKNEGPKLAVGILAAAAAAGVVVLTMGAGAPMVVFLLAGTAGYMVGSEAGAELAHSMYNTAEMRKQGLTYNARSRVGSWSAGEKVYDPETNSFISLDFEKDVLNPYALEFVQNFAMGMITVGCGTEIVQVMNKLAQSSKFVQAVLARSGITRRIVGNLKKVEQAVAEAPKGSQLQTFLKAAGKDMLGQVEFNAEQKGMESMLSAWDVELGSFGAVAIMAIKGFRPLALQRGKVPQFTVPAEGNPHEALAKAKAHLTQEGFTVMSTGPESMHVRTPDGVDVIIHAAEPVSNAASEHGDLHTLAQSGNAMGLKDVLKNMPQGIDPATRTQLATELLGHSISPKVADALELAHAKPGVIDEGNMVQNVGKSGTVYDALREHYETVEGLSPQEAHLKAMAETKILLDAGLAGAPAVARPPETAKQAPVRRPSDVVESVKRLGFSERAGQVQKEILGISSPEGKAMWIAELARNPETQGAIKDILPDLAKKLPAEEVAMIAERLVGEGCTKEAQALVRSLVSEGKISQQRANDFFNVTERRTTTAKRLSELLTGKPVDPLSLPTQTLEERLQDVARRGDMGGSTDAIGKQLASILSPIDRAEFLNAVRTRLPERAASLKAAMEKSAATLAKANPQEAALTIDALLALDPVGNRAMADAIFSGLRASGAIDAGVVEAYRKLADGRKSQQGEIAKLLREGMEKKATPVPKPEVAKPAAAPAKPVEAPNAPAATPVLSLKDIQALPAAKQPFAYKRLLLSKASAMERAGLIVGLASMEPQERLLILDKIAQSRGSELPKEEAVKLVEALYDQDPALAKELLAAFDSTAKIPIQESIALEQGLASRKSIEHGKHSQAEKQGANTPDRVVLESIVRASEGDLPQAIEAFNREHPEGVLQRAFEAVRTTEQGVVVFNEQGRMELIEINAGNASAVLQRVKNHSEAHPEQTGFAVRQECLRRNPKIPTHEAYTNGQLPKDKAAMKAYIADPSHWIPEKRAFHEQVFREAMEKIREGSRKMSPEAVGAERVVVMLRGNTAAGKSSTLRGAQSPRLKQLNADPSTAVNPDDMKTLIRRQEKAGDRHTINHVQAHSEGSMLAERVINQSFDENLNMIVIDKRFATVGDVREVTDMAKSKGYKVIIVDVDAEAATSIARVHGGEAGGKTYTGRDPAGDDPVVPVSVIEQGHADVVANRQEVMKLADEYYLYKTDAGSQAVLVAEHRGGAVEVHDPTLFEHVTRDPAADTFVKRAMDNLRNTSRTSKGVVDTSATKVKADSMAASGKEAADMANSNFETTMRRLYAERGRRFSSASELGDYIKQVALDVNKGILKEGMLFRRADSEKFPYTRIKDLGSSYEQFTQELFKRLNDPQQDPKALAAWVEFNVDLTHHFFEDGCGKVSKALSAWVLARKDVALPEYRGRDEYYSHAPKRMSSDRPEERETQFAEWSSYYFTLFHAKKH